MNNTAAIILLSILAPLSLFAGPITKIEESGLRLTAYRQYAILTPAVREGETPPEQPRHRREIFVVLENCGNQPLTIPTFHPYVGGSYGSCRITSFSFRTESYRGRKVVESPILYRPVTLAPGESTLLPIQYQKVYSEAHEKGVEDYVSYSVEDELGQRNGWWSGSLMAPITIEDSGSGNRP